MVPSLTAVPTSSTLPAPLPWAVLLKGGGSWGGGGSITAAKLPRGFSLQRGLGRYQALAHGWSVPCSGCCSATPHMQLQRLQTATKCTCKVTAQPARAGEICTQAAGAHALRGSASQVPARCAPRPRAPPSTPSAGRFWVGPQAGQALREAVRPAGHRDSPPPEGTCPVHGRAPEPRGRGRILGTAPPRRSFLLILSGLLSPLRHLGPGNCLSCG